MVLDSKAKRLNIERAARFCKHPLGIHPGIARQKDIERGIRLVAKRNACDGIIGAYFSQINLLIITWHGEDFSRAKVSTK